MLKRFSQIGLDRLVRLDWLERTARLVQAGNNAQDVKSVLQEELKEFFRADRTDVRGSVDKSLTILLRVWLKPPGSLFPLRSEALELLSRLPVRYHLAIHWGMLAAVYPFWSSVAVQVGRLLKLQGSVAALNVQRRIREQFGERETVARRVRYVIRSYVDWSVIQETGVAGIYQPGKIIEVDDRRLIQWLVEAALHTYPNGVAPFRDLLQGPSMFPFRIRSIPAELLADNAPRFEILRHGLDQDLLALK